MDQHATYAVVSTTVGTETEAKALARRLVEGRLAACVQILPIHSVYRWQGEVEAAEEHLLLIKIRAAAFEAVAEAIRLGHPYEVPEILMTPVVAGAPDYLAWLAAATK